MTERKHRFEVEVVWTGNTGEGTRTYRSYRRDHEIRAEGRPAIPGSSDPLFRGDKTRWNPEQLLIASLSACHKLWYLHLAAEAGVVVTGYEDRADGTLLESDGGGGRFIGAVLRPVVTIAPGSDPEVAQRLHEAAAEKCFIACSVNFPVEHEATVVVAE
jgi:organic hydroperoxide reductase OsmC/OhrA